MGIVLVILFYSSKVVACAFFRFHTGMMSFLPIQQRNAISEQISIKSPLAKHPYLYLPRPDLEDRAQVTWAQMELMLQFQIPGNYEKTCSPVKNRMFFCNIWIRTNMTLTF